MKPTSKFMSACAYFNPLGDDRMKQNLTRFNADIVLREGVDHRVGMTYVGEPCAFLSGYTYVSGRNFLFQSTDENKSFWQKERMLNVMLEYAATRGYEYFAWVDADLLFGREDVFAEAERLLSSGKTVVQLFEEAVMLDDHGGVGRVVPGAATAQYHAHDWRDARHYHPGLAWAARVDWLRDVKLYDRHPGGLNDLIMTSAFLGGEVYEMQYSAELLEDIHGWVDKARRNVEVGYVPGAVVHLWHGRRDSSLRSLQREIGSVFDPDDVYVDDASLYAWRAEDSPGRDLVKQYFEKRAVQ